MNIPIESLTPEERAELDAAVQAIPADQTPLFNALMLAQRAMHRHDWNQLDNVVRGYQQMIDVRYEQEASERKVIADTMERNKTDSDRRFDAADRRFDVFERRIARLERAEERERRTHDDFDEGHP